MQTAQHTFFLIILITITNYLGISQTSPDNINFVRQGVCRMVFDENQSIPFASLEPGKIVGLSAMHPITNYSESTSKVVIDKDQLIIQSENETQTSVWIGGFNPFATYSLQLESCQGQGEIGFEFSDGNKENQAFIMIEFKDQQLSDSKIRVLRNGKEVVNESIAVNQEKEQNIPSKIFLQMLGSGLVLYAQEDGLPKVIGQSNFNTYIDLRKKSYISSFQSDLFIGLSEGEVRIKNAEINFSSGVGLADIRAITYENGDPFFDQGRLWYTMSIRGRALPHHIQGVFSMNPTVFDIKLEGIVLFDRNDGILRNEIASHIFYDRNAQIWRGLTTGFSAFANPDKEKKQLLAIESKVDPRFGFSVMKAEPFGIVGDIEDPHILFDEEAEKWRILTCENASGYKAIMLESDYWNKDFTKIAGPVTHNSTGTSIQKIGDQFYCFSGSSEREIFIYTYPDLKEVGTLKMNLPPWDSASRTRVWPNVVQLPDGYPIKYVALMMDRFNYPNMKGAHWSYGALYLYHGYD